MPPILVECPTYNGVALLLSVTTEVGSGGLYISFWVGEDVRVLR